MKTVVIHECNFYAFISVCMHVREFVCASDKFMVHMINLISNNNKASNAPDHPVYMMCIRVAYARACVWFGMHLYVYKYC